MFLQSIRSCIEMSSRSPKGRSRHRVPLSSSSGRCGCCCSSCRCCSPPLRQAPPQQAESAAQLQKLYIRLLRPVGRCVLQQQEGSLIVAVCLVVLLLVVQGRPLHFSTQWELQQQQQGRQERRRQQQQQQQQQ
ncbi:hypothetical protein, conserved [Eimeria tenella]|uniref:Uncharacterized protein n=1 Tax=Eimeria tenella TaxID=5802 RepID=U6LB70_EIMTE|nr:hypothetical protein, conserved [Eimeria tenella]CDJ44995.1 hypothetical protein, conserved [Eimeria tenella]|eukprot:XP_013235742.1 hypothetical protein, conserved [Eimeria tenella]